METTIDGALWFFSITVTVEYRGMYYYDSEGNRQYRDVIVDTKTFEVNGFSDDSLNKFNIPADVEDYEYTVIKKAFATLHNGQVIEIP